jgi:hypothetical protein
MNANAVFLGTYINTLCRCGAMLKISKYVNGQMMLTCDVCQKVQIFGNSKEDLIKQYKSIKHGR